MAKRRSRSQSSRRTGTSGRKSEAEARVERFTWFLLVLVIALLQIFPEENVPLYFVPLSGAIILFGSGFYQFRERWRVSPITWIAATVMLLLCMINISVDAEQDYTGLALLTFAAVIGFGVITGET
jgi:Na+/H+ antiporter NhaD/arsenite permease-like protein